MKCIYIYMHIKLYKLVENYKKTKKKKKRKKTRIFLSHSFLLDIVCVYIYLIIVWIFLNIFYKYIRRIQSFMIGIIFLSKDLTIDGWMDGSISKNSIFFSFLTYLPLSLSLSLSIFNKRRKIRFYLDAVYFSSTRQEF